jgi:ABC-type transport system substrate-binding protein
MQYTSYGAAGKLNDSRKSRPLWLTLLASSLLLVACGGEAPQTNAVTQTNAGGTDNPELKVYRHAMDGAPSSIDPVQSSNVYANTVVLNTYDTLYAFKYLARPYQIKANLAVDMPEVSDDSLVYRIRIKQGVYFVDDPAFEGGIGRELTADDFVYSIKRQFDPSQRPAGTWFWQGRIVGLDEWKAAGSDYGQKIDGLQALDRYTIQITLIKPYPQLVFTLAQGYSAIVPHEAVEKYGRELASHPVGSGPFKMISYDSTKIALEKNKKFRQEPVDIYFEGYDPATQKESGVEAIQGRSPPFVDRMEIHFISQGAARWSSFTKGNEVQYLGVPNEQLDSVFSSKNPITPRAEIAEKYHVGWGLEAGLVFMTFNMSFPEIGYNDDPEQERKNKALRCAMIKAFDWDRRNESFYFSLGSVFPGIIPPTVPEFDPNLSRESVTRDLEGARKQLADNGWTPENLPTLVYGSQAGVSQRLFFEQFRGFMVKIGYPTNKLKLKQYATFGDYSKAMANNKLPLVSKGWGLDYPDAENTLQLFYGPNGSPGSNDANYKNPEYDRLFEKSAVMMLSEERTAIYRQMNQMVIDDCIAIMSLSRTRSFMWHKDVIAVPDREIVGGFFMKYVDIDKSLLPADSKGR